MKRYDKINPEGTKDYIFDECRIKRQAESTLSVLFEGYGYGEIMTPALEYYDVYSQGRGKIPPEELYTLTDNGGKLLVLRSDSTKPVARLYSARLQGCSLPLRVYYNQTVYRRNIRFNRKLDEIIQIGAELLGGGAESDFEILLLALKSLKALFGDKFLLELGHADIMRSVMENLPADIKEDAVAAVRTKNYPEVMKFAETLGEKGEIFKSLFDLPSGAEIPDKAEALFKDDAAEKAVAHLKNIYNALSEAGFSENVVVDLSAINDYEYYTGITFKGFVEGGGCELLSGGRYDTLYCDYDLNMPATGFSLNISEVVRIKRKEGGA